MNMVKVGDKIYGVWGAMHPVVYGVVDRIDENDVVYFSDEHAPEEVYTTPAEYIRPLTNGVNSLPTAVGVYA